MFKTDEPVAAQSQDSDGVLIEKYRDILHNDGYEAAEDYLESLPEEINKRVALTIKTLDIFKRAMRRRAQAVSPVTR